MEGREVEDFGGKLRSPRVRLGYTQAEFARLLGVSFRAVQHGEGGREGLPTGAFSRHVVPPRRESKWTGLFSKESPGRNASAK